MTPKHILLLSLCVVLISLPVRAQESGNANEPLEITADHSLEWDRANQTFTATKNALAVQGDVSIAGQKLIAHYRDDEKSDLEIWQVEAETDITITSRENKAYGQKATYNIDDGLAIMTGNNLRLTSPDQVVTARERFEYHVTEGRLDAIGGAKVIRLEDTLAGDIISATMKENAKGERVLDTLEAKGNVVITTPTETVTGAYGIYNSATNKATITGGVTIKRGPNVLQGAKAEVDLATNISRMFSSTQPGSGGRVRGVFYPNSGEKNDE